jgi:hypothetical protein
MIPMSRNRGYSEDSNIEIAVVRVNSHSISTGSSSHVHIGLTP